MQRFQKPQKEGKRRKRSGLSKRVDDEKVGDNPEFSRHSNAESQVHGRRTRSADYGGFGRYAAKESDGAVVKERTRRALASSCQTSSRNLATTCVRRPRP